VFAPAGRAARAVVFSLTPMPVQEDAPAVVRSPAFVIAVRVVNAAVRTKLELARADARAAAGGQVYVIAEVQAVIAVTRTAV